MFPRANSPENRLRWILKSRIAVPSIEPWRTCSFRLTTGLGRQKSSILITCLLLCWHCTLHQRVKAGLGELNTLFQRWVYHSLMLDKLVQRTPQKEVNLWTASRQDALHIFLLHIFLYFDRNNGRKILKTKSLIYVRQITSPDGQLF